MKKLILFSILLLLVPIAYAELILTPSGGFSGSTFVGTATLAEISVYNSFSYPIFKINFSNIQYATLPYIEKLEINETKKYNISILTDSSFSSRTQNSVVKFWYYSSIFPDAKTWDINITDSGFFPNSITIKRGDSLRFTNWGNYTSVLKDDAGILFDQICYQNQSVTISVFTQIATIPFHDVNDMTKYGVIIVQNITSELVTNPDYNKIFTLIFDSKYKDSELGIELYPTNEVSMKYNEQTEVSLRVWNKGNTTIRNITLSSDDYKNWFSYETNNFQLTPSENKYIDIQVTPYINQSSDTNKTYSIDLIVDGENAGAMSVELKIFIEYEKNIWDLVNMSKEQLMEQIIALRKVLESIDWSSENRVQYIYLNSTIEFTKEDMFKNLRELNQKTQSTDENIIKLTKSLNDQLEIIQKILLSSDQFKLVLNESNSLSKSAKKISDDNFTSLLLYILFSIIVGGSIWIYIIIKKRKKAKLSQTYH